MQLHQPRFLNIQLDGKEEAGEETVRYYHLNLDHLIVIEIRMSPKKLKSLARAVLEATEVEVWARESWCCCFHSLIYLKWAPLAGCRRNVGYEQLQICFYKYEI